MAERLSALPSKTVKMMTKAHTQKANIYRIKSNKKEVIKQYWSKGFHKFSEKGKQMTNSAVLKELKSQLQLKEAAYDKQAESICRNPNLRRYM